MSLALALAWIVLLLIHVMPALAAFSPRLRQRMYGIEEGGVLGVILAHRGFLFLAVAAACGYAAFNEPARPLATIVTAITVLSFLALYAMHSAPKALRQIALVDLVGVPPLAFVAADAFALI